MAKLGDPLDTTAIAEQLALVVRYEGTGTKRRAVLYRPWSQANSAQALMYRTKFREAVTSWKNLSLWKQTRWILCAYRQGQPANPPTGWKGWTGHGLYIAEWIAQNIQTGKQPISPCSRRATDPSANPWDYTP